MLGRLTKRTPTHTPVPQNPAVEPLAVSFLNSFFWYELDTLAVSFLNSFFWYELDIYKAPTLHLFGN